MKSFFYIIFILYIISIKSNEIEENSSELYVQLYDINDNIENLLQTENKNLNLYKIKTSYSKEELNELLSNKNLTSPNKKEIKKLKKEIKEEKKLHKKEDKLLVEQMDKEKNSSMIKKPLDEYIQKEDKENKFLNYKLSTKDLKLNEESFSYAYSILLFLIVIGLLLFGIQFVLNKNENMKKEDYLEFEEQTDKLLKGY